MLALDGMTAKQITEVAEATKVVGSQAQQDAAIRIQMNIHSVLDTSAHIKSVA